MRGDPHTGRKIQFKFELTSSSIRSAFSNGSDSERERAKATGDENELIHFFFNFSKIGKKLLFRNTTVRKSFKELGILTGRRKIQFKFEFYTIGIFKRFRERERERLTKDRRKIRIKKKIKCQVVS